MRAPAADDENMHRWRHLLMPLVAVMAVVVVSGCGPVATSSAYDVGLENAFVARINSARVAAGLPPDVGVLPALRDGCRAQSDRMAAEGRIWHDPAFGADTQAAYPKMAWAGENVGAGYDISLHEAFMNSPAHKAAILGTHRYIGVGVVKRADGAVYVCERFLRSSPTDAYDGQTVPLAGAVPGT